MNATEILPCSRCPLPIDTSALQYVRCRLCSNPYHYLCAAITSEQLNVLSVSDRVLWLCDKCFASFGSWKEEQILEPPLCAVETTQQQIVELQCQVSGIITTLAEMTSKMNSTSIDLPSYHTKPVSSSTLLQGSNSNEHCFNENHTSSGEDNDSFALYLTNIDSSVSENDINSMVSRCLEVSNEDFISVKKLVPKWVDCSKLDFVSFKVVLHEKLKLRALIASTWPRGIKFREFINRFDHTWKPECKT